MGSDAQDWKRAIGFEEETTWGSKSAESAIEWQRFYEDDDIWFSRELVDLTGTEETRDRVEHADGEFIAEGNSVSNIEFLPDTIRTMLKCLFGEETGSNPYTYAPAAASIPSFTLYKRAGEVYTAIVGNKIHAAEFAFNRGILRVSLELRSRHPESLTSVTFPNRSYSNKKPFMFWGLVLSYGGSNQLIKEGTLRFQNTLPDNDFYSGSPYTYEHAEGVREIGGSMTLTFDSIDQAEEFLSHPDKALSITATSPHGDTLVFTLPRIMVEGGWRIAKTENLHRLERPWRAEVDSIGSDIISAVLTII